jgi:predicted adenine nucleotide alpha hydrolase (AANH) superfamily ATPase
MKVLLHICCANCACYPVEELRRRGFEVRGLFFNPNIQPYTEYLRRREAVEQLATAVDLPVIYMDGYPLDEFLRRIVFREDHRCRICYQWRLETAARVAKRGHYDRMTTTLLFSKHQQHQWISEIAEHEAAAKGTRFLYEDFRKGWQEGRQRSIDLGLYRQTYCGCIYSERDRYLPRNRTKSERAKRKRRI